ncbi:MAG: ABC transporter permease, partial [Acidimicrobiales bacterium]
MKYLLRRLAYLVAILLAVTFTVSALLELLPGDAAVAVAGENASPEQVQIVRERLNLDRPLVTRYVDWLSHAARGDLGQSLRNDEKVTHELRLKLPITLEVVILAQLSALAFAFVTACFISVKRNSVADGAATVGSFAFISLPQFVLGVLLIYFFAVKLEWLPVSGFSPIKDGLWNNLQSVALPVFTVAADPAAIYQRLLRHDIGKTLQEDYITMAHAKGLSPTRVLLRHTIRPSLFSTTTLAGIITARMIGGSVIVESLFGLPGLGRLLVEAINARDYVVVQGVVALVAAGYVVINAAVDILYGFL